jgi:DNA-binding response OmpR family regulator
MVSLELQPGAGLVRPTSFPTRRREDRRPDLDPDRLLLITLGEGPGDLRLWANGLFKADVVSKPFEAMNHLEPGADYGVVLVHAPRGSINEAIQACRAIRPLTRGGIVFVTDDGVRSNDRVSFLEAGADDALTGGLDFRELEIRVRQAARRGGRSPDDDEARPRRVSTPVKGGRVGVPELIAHIRERRARNGAGLFSLLTLTSDVDGALEALEPHLIRQIRDEDGDMVSRSDGGLMVLLAGARESQTESFLRRFRSSLRGAISAPSFQVRVACHPSNTNEVEAMLEAVGGART